MPPYAVLCYTPGCGRPAHFKVASRWSDGVTAELKTYGLCCESCLPEWYARGVERQAQCRLVPGERLDPPGIFDLVRGCRDPGLRSRPDLVEVHGIGMLPSGPRP